MNAKNVAVFFVVLCGANETSDFSFGGESSSSILFSVHVKYRTELSLKIPKTG